MKTFSIAITVLALFGLQNLGWSQNSKNKNLQAEKQLSGSFTLNYLLYLPENYNESSDVGFPIILFLHGSGERGNNLELVKQWGPPKIADEKGLPFIVISPQCPINSYWPAIIEPLKYLLDTCIKNLNVDTSRIYLTGLSMGGFGTFSLSQMYPEYFAAIAPVCGGGTPYLSDRAKDIPTWVFHGAIDDVVPLESSQMMVTALKQNGADVKFTIYENVGHDSWIKAYDESGIFDWFLQHKK